MLPEAFLANAERMLMAENAVIDQCASRAIVHAAYYAVFHLMANRLNVPVSGNDPIKHGDVQRLLIAYSGLDHALQEGKRLFKSLRLARNDADYLLASSVTKDQARDAVDWAFEIFDAAGITPSPA